MGFMCNSEASDIRVHRQSTKVWYQLNSDKPYHGFRDYKGEGGSRGGGGQFLTQSAALHTLTLFSLLVYFPLIYSCLLCSPSLSSGTEANEPNVSVCLLGQVNIWNDRGWRWLDCWRRCLRAKWRTIRETVIRCMHACRATECSPWTAWCHLVLRRAITWWEPSIKLQSNSIKAESKIKLMSTHAKRCCDPQCCYYSCTVTSYYCDAFSLQLAFLYWATKQRAFKS